jgi:hypothetical protein
MTVKLSRKGMAAVMAGVLTIPASGIIVYDPINEVHHVKNLAESIKIMQQAVTTYNRITDQYNHMKYMAQYLKNMPGRYKAPLTPWKGMSATSTYGTTNRWIAAVNQGIDSMQGWESATLPSVDFAGAFGNIPASQQPRRKAEFATLELQDGAGVSALETIGRIRGNGPQVETTRQCCNLEMSVRSKEAWSDDHAVGNPRRRPTNATCPAMSCFGNHLTCPLRIMFTVSIP